MIEENTLFILGAGASVFYGYPTGDGLKKDIINFSISNMNPYLLTDDNVDDEYDHNKIRLFCNRFENSNDSMIDYFLNTLERKDLVKLGKALIAASIIKHEKISSGIRPINIKDNWFEILFKKMTEGFRNNLDYQLFNENKVSFITFNYDRSLEYYFALSLQNKFGIDNTTISNIMNKIKIRHVFGRLPELPSENELININYGDNFTINDFTKTIDNIKTLTERANVNKSYIDVLIKNAKRIFILGFAFAEENLNILNFHRNITESKKVYCTALGLSEHKIKILKHTLIPSSFTNSNNIPQPITHPEIYPVKSSELLRDYL